MSTLWLRDIDFLSRAVPRGLFRRIPRAPRTTAPAILLRPGGLGDLVILSRAVLELGASPASALWVIERRNAPWAEYLDLPHICYDGFKSLSGLLLGRTESECVVNTEQTFGLSSLLAERLVASRGLIFGFASNRCASLYDQQIEYRSDTQELSCFKLLLSAAGIPERLPAAEHKLERNLAASEERRHVVVAIAGRQEKYKRIGFSSWSAMLKRALQEGQKVIVVGTKRDRLFSEELCSRFGSVVQNLTGELEFAAVVETVKRAGRLYSVDSGLVHVADFFGVPSEVLFTSGLESKWGPITPGSKVVSVANGGDFGGGM